MFVCRTVKDVGTLRKVCRCAGLVDNVASKLTAITDMPHTAPRTLVSTPRTPTPIPRTPTPTPRPSSAFTPRTPRGSSSGASCRPDDSLTSAGDGVTAAITELVGLIERHLTLRLASQDERPRRMLPQTPSATRHIRCQSATDGRRLDRWLALQHIGASSDV